MRHVLVTIVSKKGGRSIQDSLAELARRNLPCNGAGEKHARLVRKEHEVVGED